MKQQDPNAHCATLGRTRRERVAATISLVSFCAGLSWALFNGMSYGYEGTPAQYRLHTNGAYGLAWVLGVFFACVAVGLVGVLLFWGLRLLDRGRNEAGADTGNHQVCCVASTQSHDAADDPHPGGKRSVHPLLHEGPVRLLPRTRWSTWAFIFVGLGLLSTLTVWLSFYVNSVFIEGTPFFAVCAFLIYWTCFKHCPQCRQRLKYRREGIGATFYRELYWCERCQIDWDGGCIGDTRHD